LQKREILGGWPGAFGLLAITIVLAACGGGGRGGATVAASCPSTQGLVPPPAPALGVPTTTLSLLSVATGLSTPLFLTAPPNDRNRALIVEKNGAIKVLDLTVQPNQVLATPFLTVADVNPAGEQGLLGLAFHPDYANNGFFYVYVSNSSGDSEIRRYQVSGNPNVADPASATPVITISQEMPDGSRFSNHKAGWLGFGPNDGFLYAALGDGGSAGDPFARAQNLGTLLGKMLRVDVDADDFPGDPARNYAIPADNPCVGQAGALPEIWSMGLRNPWRPSFDRDTGDFYIADVGQGRQEEVNVATAASGAGSAANFGWDIMEGSLCHEPGAGCTMTGLTLPFVEYDHGGSGGCSITGGYVYRGTAIPGLAGTYFYGDFCAGFVRSFRLAGGMVTEHTAWGAALAPPGGNITSFGEDGAGDLYIMTSDALFRIVQ
jgi:glucose/arabinose dehydrogenase